MRALSDHLHVVIGNLSKFDGRGAANEKKNKGFQSNVKFSGLLEVIHPI